MTAGHALDIAFGHATNGPADHSIKPVLVTFSHYSHRLEDAVGVMLMPGSDLLFWCVGQAQQHAGCRHKPDHLQWRFGKGHVRDLVVVKQVSRTD